MISLATTWLLGRPWFAAVAKYAAIALTVTLAMLALYKHAERAGRLIERAEAMGRIADQRRRRDETDREIDRMRPGAAAGELQREWSRDG